jgi:AcrR family transcriptional regulator
MPRSKQKSRESILEAVESVLRKRGAHSTTMDTVATEAGCAKGLVHYHFDTKQKLLVEAVSRIAKTRETAWNEAFDTPDPQEAVDRTWSLIRKEADSGTLRAWSSLVALGDPEVDRAVSIAAAALRELMAEGTERLFEATGVEPGVPTREMGWLLAAVVHGVTFHAASGADLSVLENAYAAAWLGLLSLTTQRD